MLIISPNGLILGLPRWRRRKESACNRGDLGSIPVLGRSPGKGKGYPLQYSGLENSMDCIVPGVTKSRTWLSNVHFHFTCEVPPFAFMLVTKSLCYITRNHQICFQGIKIKQWFSGKWWMLILLPHCACVCVCVCVRACVCVCACVRVCVCVLMSDCLWPHEL